MGEAIDIVIPWVNSNDQKWQIDYQHFANKADKRLNGTERFRDYGMLKYVFRSIDNFAPWVHKIYLVTNGQKPEWLNLKQKKLVLVQHSDYIESKFLPTFNSNVIESNLFRIKSLTENFILFNDDTLLNTITTPTDFFKYGLPRDSAVLSPVFPTLTGIDHIVMNDLAIVNQYFSKREVMQQYWWKFYNIKYGSGFFKNLLLSPYTAFCGFYDFHTPMAYKKTTFKRVWNIPEVELETLSSHRFRTDNDTNHWLVRYWQLCSGQFTPRKSSFTAYYSLDQIAEVANELANRNSALVCVNDKDIGNLYGQYVSKLQQLLQKKFPVKSSFEN